MAASVHDVLSTTTSAEIFSSHHTLPQIRAIHRSFHVAVDENSARLRAQVGASYRDLLGTADSIVQMHSDNNSVQGLLGRMGGQCGRAVIGKKITNLGDFTAWNDVNTESQELAQVARAKLLERCGLVAGRTLKGRIHGTAHMSRGDRLLLASKVYVLGRLLVKSFRDEGGFSPDVGAIVDTAEHTTAALKRQLLQRISKVLEFSDEANGQADVIKTLCAYSLATSSGTRDVLRYFLRVRGDAISTKFSDEKHGLADASDAVLASLRLYTTTMVHVQALVPHKLADAIASLKKSPLVADDTLLSLDGLRLDVCRRWCGDEIQYYTPFIRHDDLAGPQARTMLATWAERGGEVIVAGLETSTGRMTDFQGIVGLRTAVLQFWIRDGGKAKGFDPSEMLNSLRATLNNRMLQVIETKVGKLHLVASEVAATLRTKLDAFTDRQVNIWADNNGVADTIGADHFLQELVTSLHGRNDSVSKAVNCFNSWKHVIDGVSQQMDILGKQRWDNDIDEIEDEETINARQQLLSRDDPQALRDALESALERGFQELDVEVATSWETSSSALATSSGRMAMFVIRVLRDIRAGMPQYNSVAAKQFGFTTVPLLHARLAETIAASPVEAFTSTLLTQKLVIGRALWEGAIELPIQPSPHAFKLLRDASQAMAEAGMDLWSLAAVDAVKKQLRVEISKAWRQAIDNLSTDVPTSNAAHTHHTQHDDETDNGSPAGAADSGGTPERTSKSVGEQEKQELMIQWLFDISFLRLCLGSTAEGPGEFSGLEERVVAEGSQLDESAKQRIVKSAQAYWKKTSLLFSILVVERSG
ncbi:hypothetical protein F5X68DRAFT_217832 [Plectosphaerella plurivora]|uniref:Conserved oligomeric Golgi complex subunit 1 n=1 Tax=Plectosphaerella plurivora TaxID=936078 RepID=A0A9P9A6C3_9PEZI|nr:hypothetical protein F5X68DRAFT_217832 [Plectosphaerella plurivora]